MRTFWNDLYRDVASHYCLFVAGFIAVLVAANRVEATIVTADFDDGNTAAAVDGYVGTAGGGWAGPWEETYEDSLTIGNTVLAGPGGPISGGGNYLSASVAPDLSTDNNSRYGLGRDFSAGIDLTLPYRIEFAIRIDEDVDSVNTTFTDYHDRYNIADSIANQFGTNNSNSWSIYAHGGTGSLAHAGAVGQWAFYSGDNDNTFAGNNTTKMISTGIALTTGGVYEFTIDVFPNADPALGTWSATVDDGTNSFTKTDMGYRANDGVKPYLYFMTKKSQATPADAADDVREFSVDGIRISQPIPEPSTMVLVAWSGVLWLGTRRRCAVCCQS